MREIIQAPDGSQTVVPDPRPLADQQADRLSKLAATRWQRSQAFAYAYDGTTYAMPCDTAAAANVTAAIVASQLPGAPDTRTWKFADGVTFSLASSDILALGQAMAAHVQACFDNEAALAAQITAATDADTLDAIDIGAGWSG